MQTLVQKILICPACHGDLDWDITEENADHILEALATCRNCEADYPVREGIALFLTPDLSREDLWAAVDNRFAKIFAQYPDLEHKLMHTPLTDLNPADLFFRSMVLEERREWDASLAISQSIDTKLYSPEYVAGQRQQIEAVVNALVGSNEPIVDLACGRGRLVEELLRHTSAPVIATDFSPKILRRNRDYFAHLGLSERLSLVACDARRLPFKAESVPTLTSFVGLANIDKAGEVIQELQRVVAGRLMAISIFYDPADTAHADLIKKFGMEGLLYEMALLGQFDDLGWAATLEQRFDAQVFPTPVGDIFEAGVDGLPIAETTLTWGTIVATTG